MKMKRPILEPNFMVPEICQIGKHLRPCVRRPAQVEVFANLCLSPPPTLRSVTFQGQHEVIQGSAWPVRYVWGLTVAASRSQNYSPTVRSHAERGKAS